MNAVVTEPRRVENLHTDKGKVPVYATGIVEQPWDSYSDDDHATWATLYARQRELLVGRACNEFLDAQDAMGMTPDRIPKFAELNVALEAATGWTLIGVEGLLPELEMADIAALVAPRPLVIEAGERDPLFPIIATREAFSLLPPVWEARGAVPPELVVTPGGHAFRAERSLEALCEHLAG